MQSPNPDDLLVVDGDDLCRVRIFPAGSVDADAADTGRAAEVPGLGLVVGCLVRKLGGRPPASRGPDRRASHRTSRGRRASDA